MLSAGAGCVLDSCLSTSVGDLVGGTWQVENAEAGERGQLRLGNAESVACKILHVRVGEGEQHVGPRHEILLKTLKPQRLEAQKRASNHRRSVSSFSEDGHFPSRQEGWHHPIPTTRVAVDVLRDVKHIGAGILDAMLGNLVLDDVGLALGERKLCLEMRLLVNVECRELFSRSTRNKRIRIRIINK